MPVTWSSKLPTASRHDDCPETWEELPIHSRCDYLYLLDNHGDFVRTNQGILIIVGDHPEFPVKLETTSRCD